MFTRPGQPSTTSCGSPSRAALEAVDFSPWSLSLELFELSVVQDAHPEPPVARFPRAAFGVHWRSLLAARLVSDVLLEEPHLHVHLAQLREERTDEVEIDDRGWQDALLAALPAEDQRAGDRRRPPAAG